MPPFPVSPAAFVRHLWAYRDLLMQMTERDTRSRYRGTAGGIVWSVFHPILMLAVYVFFFGQVFPAKWPVASERPADFALILFVGLLLHGFFTEAVMRAPAVVVGQPNLVRKVVFPLDLLPVVAVGSAIFHLLVGLAILLVFHFVVRGVPPVTALMLPIVIAPLVVCTLGIAWALASLGVYLRDVAHVVPVVCAVLLFLSPVFFPADVLASPYRELVSLSPLTVPITQARDVLLWGRWPDPVAYAIYAAISLAVAWMGLFWFQGTRKGFADVL